MKKILSLLLATLMVVTCVATLASCGKASAKLKVVDVKLTSEEYAFAVQKGDADMLKKVNDFMKKIQENGKFAEIVNKYFGDGTPTPVTSASTMKTDGSQLIVATNAAFEPFEYMSGEKYLGIDMEIMALFAEELGKELYIYNMEFDAVCLSVSATGGTWTDENGKEHTQAGGVCDVAAAGLTVNETRKAILDFSSSYYSASQMIIAAEDDKTFDECKTKEDVEKILKTLGKDVSVGVQNGTTGKLYCEGDADWGFEGYGFTTAGYTNGALAAQEILNGNCKYVIIDEGPAKAIASRINEAN